MPEGTTKESRCFVRGWACHARITPGYDTDMYDIGTLLKTSDQSRRIISMSEPRSSTRRFNGRTIVPGIMPSSPRSYGGSTTAPGDGASPSPVTTKGEPPLGGTASPTLPAAVPPATGRLETPAV